MASFSKLPPGDYLLGFAVRDPASHRTIGLSLVEGDTSHTYRLGPVHLVASRAAGARLAKPGGMAEN